MSRWQNPLRPAACRRAARLLQSWLDGELDELTARRVAAHLEECRRCGLEAATYAQIKNALARRGAVPAEAAERLRAFGENLAAAGEADDHGTGEAQVP